MTDASPTVDDALTRLEGGTGEEYRAQRDQLLASASPELVQGLRAAAGRSADPTGWRRTWIARAVLAWHDDPHTCQQVTRYVRGDLDHRGPCTSAAGAWDARVRASDLGTLGPAAIPRVVEMLIATRDFRDDEGQQLPALVMALDPVDPAELEPLFVDLLRHDPSMPVRMTAAAWLGGHPTSLGDVELDAILREPSLPWSLRAECLAALGVRGELGPALTEIVEAADEPPGLKAAAISALALRDPAAAAKLVRAALPSESRLELSTRYVDVVARHGSGDDRALLQAVAGNHPSPIVRAKAQRAAAALGRGGASGG